MAISYICLGTTRSSLETLFRQRRHVGEDRRPRLHGRRTTSFIAGVQRVCAERDVYVSRRQPEATRGQVDLVDDRDDLKVVVGQGRDTGLAPRVPDGPGLFSGRRSAKPDLP